MWMTQQMKLGCRGIPCLCILGKPYNLGAWPSERFSVNSSFVELFCFNPDTNMLTVFSVALVGYILMAGMSTDHTAFDCGFHFCS